MKKISRALISFLVFLGLAASIEAQTNPNARGSEESSVPNSQYDNHQRRMSSLKAALKNAKTYGQRKEIYSQIQQEIEQHQSATSPTELTPEMLTAQKQKIEEKLRKDPHQGGRYQLPQSILNVKSEGELKKTQNIQTIDASNVETKMTPEQQVTAQKRRMNSAKTQAMLKLLTEQLYSANNEDERKAIHIRIREVISKY